MMQLTIGSHEDISETAFPIATLPLAPGLEGISLLGSGQHHIKAVHSADAVFTGTTSPAITLSL